MVKRYETLDLKPTTKIREACEMYQRTSDFAKLKGATQIKYEYNFNTLSNLRVQNGKMLGLIQLKNLSFKHINYAYERSVEERGLSAANYAMTCLSVVLNAAVRNEAIVSNPISYLRKKQTKPRRVKWTSKQVEAFLKVAYDEWKWRSIGLILQMAYEWGQRLGDMRLLKWEQINWEEYRVDILQSKRGAAVHLPISDELMVVLKQQYEYFKFQEYVAPRVVPRNGGYGAYNINEIHTQVNNIKREANLPFELQARDLRRTAITEMAEAGVDAVGIMQVSGHQNISSVQPYLVNTFAGASHALAKRRGENTDE